MQLNASISTSINNLHATAVFNTYAIPYPHDVSLAGWINQAVESDWLTQFNRKTIRSTQLITFANDGA